MKLIVVMPDGKEHVLEGTNSWQVMEIIKHAGLPIRAECGGACACATCHVYVDPEWIGKMPERKPEEMDMLDMALEVRDTSRLSCQIVYGPELDGLRVTVAPDAV
jgi:ferredoxin, 2Fe-2S